MHSGSRKDRIGEILRLFDVNYPIKGTFLQNCSTPFQFLTAVVLSAQSTDKQVNSITKQLFLKFPDPKSMNNAKIEDIEYCIKSVGLYKNKAKFLKNIAQTLVLEYDSQVPASLNQLLKLPGVGRKSANVVMNDWFKEYEGIAVDTHVKRLSSRLGFTINRDVKKIEKDLMEIIPQEKWGKITLWLISHGRKYCKAQQSLCEECFLNYLCPKIGVGEKNE